MTPYHCEGKVEGTNNDLLTCLISQYMVEKEYYGVVEFRGKFFLQVKVQVYVYKIVVECCGCLEFGDKLLATPMLLFHEGIGEAMTTELKLGLTLQLATNISPCR